MSEGQKKKILIIEDDRYIAKMYQTKLSLDGFEVELAENGAAGVEKAKSFLPDIILLDILMPEMDGFQVLESIRGDDTISFVPVIIMSNLAKEEHVKKARVLGVKDYIIKSQITPQEVVQRIKKVMAAS